MFFFSKKYPDINASYSKINIEQKTNTNGKDINIKKENENKIEEGNKKENIIKNANDELNSKMAENMNYNNNSSKME